MKLANMGRGKPKGKDGQVGWGGDEEGPRVHIDHERAKKIGWSQPPAVGSEHHLQGHARVIGSREEPSTDGKSGPVHSIEIVIHHMGATPVDADGDVDGEPPQDRSEDGYGKPDRRASVRKDVEAAAETVEKRKAVTARTDKKIPEKAGGK